MTTQMTTHRQADTSRRWRLAALLAGMLVAMMMLITSPAQAIPPDGAGPNTPGASSTTSPTSGLRAGDTLSFTVRGFPGGETLYIKIDDGQNCSQAAVHGACVYHQQVIPGSGTVSGSIVLPYDIAPGQHWLRFLASEEMRDSSGNVIGTQGYTLRGQNFTVASNSSSSGGGSGSGGSGSGSSDSGSSGSGGSGSGGSGSGGGSSTGGAGQSSGGGSTGNSVITGPGTDGTVGQDSGQLTTDAQPGAEGGLTPEVGEGESAGGSLAVDWGTEEEADDVQESEQQQPEDEQAGAALLSAEEPGDQQASSAQTPATSGPPWVGVLVMVVLLAASGLIVASALRGRRGPRTPAEG